MRRKVEQEGYLQDGIKRERPCLSKLPHKTCVPTDHLHPQNQFYIPVQTHVGSQFVYSHIFTIGECLSELHAANNLK